MARLGKLIGSLGYGTVFEAGTVYVFDKSVSDESRRRVGIVERLYECGKSLTLFLT